MANLKSKDTKQCECECHQDIPDVCTGCMHLHRPTPSVQKSWEDVFDKEWKGPESTGRLLKELIKKVENQTREKVLDEIEKLFSFHYHDDYGRASDMDHYELFVDEWKKLRESIASLKEDKG